MKRILGWLYDLPFDHTYDLDLWLSRSESKLTLSREWDGRLTWNAKGASHPFMSKISTNVTMVGWAHVPDRDRGDFRHRRALDISSWYYVHSLTKFIHRSCMPRQVRRKNIKLHWWYLNPTAFHGLRIRMSAGPEWKSGFCIYTGQARNYLTLREPNYRGLIRSLSWLLMLWLRLSPGHQQPQYWSCEIGKHWSFMRRDLDYLGLLSVMFPMKNLTHIKE